MLLLSKQQLQESANRFSKIEEVEFLKAGVTGMEMQGAADPLLADRVRVVEPNAEKLEQRKQMILAESIEPPEFAYERAIGNNDSVYSNFIELIVAAKRKVGRIICKSGARVLGHATGFMVSDRLMLTNWHVFKTKEHVADSQVQFFYEYDIHGKEITSYCFELKEDEFFHSNKQYDYCLVAVAPIDETGAMTLKEIGSLYLNPALGKLGEKEEALNVIHHPDGDYKQLSVRENLFVKMTDTSVWYQSDTAPGSSGSPVFNDQWQVVALHHMGVGKMNEAGEYIDKEGNTIPEIDGKVDEGKIQWIANEGIRTSVILNDVFTTFVNHPLVEGLKSEQPGTSSITPERKIKSDEQIKPNTMDNTNSNDVRIAIPSSLIENNIEVTIKVGKPQRPVLAAPVLEEEEADFAELKKLEKEMDFSRCDGYKPGFLDETIALPKPLKPLKKYIAKLNDSTQTELKYYNYSVLFHSVRRMPAISAVNVDGNKKKRLDDAKRKDNWLKDNRIDFDIQLDDSYYKTSGFDRGHMSRREDANWGANAEDAKRNADLTCMHTNACPQVAALNQSKRQGLWGQLELIVLEQGTIKEGPLTNKMSVFNGPIFEESDPVFRGVQVPMSFFKIIIWPTDKNGLKATAFKLSQENLVEDIEFEQINIDQNVQFKPYRYSIRKLQEETQLDFSALFPLDTYNDDESEVNSAEKLTAEIKKIKESAA